MIAAACDQSVLLEPQVEVQRPRGVLLNHEPPPPALKTGNLEIRTDAMVREVLGQGTLVPEEVRWIAAKTAARVDPSRGRAVFAKTCQQCHTLFGTGGKIGPPPRSNGGTL